MEVVRVDLRDLADLADSRLRRSRSRDMLELDRLAITPERV
jgi:hypothetical protein